MNNEIVLYQANELSSRIDVRVEAETVWLNRNQLAVLFNRDVKTIDKHINNVFSEGELDKKVVVAKFATTTLHGTMEGKYQTKNVEYYNLDVIISIGYRVKSKQGTQFRIWANRILKDYLLKGYSLNNRFNKIEDDVYSFKQKVDRIDLQISAEQLPKQGIFFEGQVFDAYNFVSDLFRKAEKSIVIVDNYIDDTVLVHLTKINKGVQVRIVTKSISDQFRLDLKKFAEQYFTIEVKVSKDIRDRIYSIRGYQVMLDSDLAELYGVETKVLNQSVKRNIERLPSEFCFLLKYSEVPELRSQFVTSNKAEISLRSQMMPTKKGGRRNIPYVFTQEGVAMLSAVLKSEIAVKMSIKIMKAFIEMRKFIQANGQIFQRLDRVEVKLFENFLFYNSIFYLIKSILRTTLFPSKASL
ncbi:MAG TPA: RhuM family protein [Clostridiales bacterium]|nr:RhuM family protein [Clostridiales bacterium]HQP70792.1 RhuM family protein [Clostridiales bacterium]